MEIRKMNAARGWVWVKQGYQLIMRNPMMSISFALLGAFAVFGAVRIPMFGPLFAVLLMPILVAGYMRMCRALEEEEEVELSHLFQGFRTHTAGLLALGGFAMLGLLAASAVMMYLGGDKLGALLDNLKSASDPQVLTDAMSSAGSGVMFSLLTGFTLVCLLMLAMQYAPMLVFFSGIKPFAALRASLAGSLRNIIPYTVYSIILQLVALLLSIVPFNLGLVVLFPLGLTSLYVSYRNIFPFAGELEVEAPPKLDMEA